MSEMVLHDMGQYPLVLRRVLQYGERRAPRGQETLDLGFMSIVLLNQRGGLPLGLGRNLKPAIGAVEAAQLVAAVSDPNLVLKVAPQFGRYLDKEHGDPFFWGAYGERIKLQAYNAINKLMTDLDTRQAIVTLWDPWMDNVKGKKDYPCTIALQFSIRDGLLDMNVIMRSNDVWLGLPYDVFQFTQLQASMARAMNTTPGIYRHTALSLHLYTRDQLAAQAMLELYNIKMAEVTEAYHSKWQPDGFGRVGDSFGTIMDRAHMILRNESFENETASEVWYRDQLHGRGTAA